MEREHLKSRLGFILLSAGCAIGIGNVWKFPYMAGQYGGGMFVLIYLFFLVVMGMPVLIMEFSLGRASRKSPVKLYDALEPAGTKWHLHGYAAMAGNYLLMMFYTVVAGWMLKYFFSTATGTFEGMTSSGGGGKSRICKYDCRRRRHGAVYLYHHYCRLFYLLVQSPKRRRTHNQIYDACFACHYACACYK